MCPVHTFVVQTSEKMFTDVFYMTHLSFFLLSELPDCVVGNLTGNFTVTDTPVYFTSPGYPDNYNS